MAKKMQRLDESPDFRPFKFRIQAFTTAFLEEVKSKKLDAEFTSGEEMETMAKEMMSQRPEVVERLRKVLGN